MDPNAALQNIRTMASQLLSGEGKMAEALDLAEFVQGLDEWLAKGGFKPTAWEQASEGRYTTTRWKYAEEHAGRLIDADKLIRITNEFDVTYRDPEDSEDPDDEYTRDMYHVDIIGERS